MANTGGNITTMQNNNNNPDLLSDDFVHLPQQQQEQQPPNYSSNQNQQNQTNNPAVPIPEWLQDHPASKSSPNNNNNNNDYVAMEGGAGAAVPAVYDESEESSDDDKDDKSAIESVLTADGIHDIVGFYCVCGVILIGDMSRGVMFPSMWPLVEALGGSQVLLGYSVAAFSFGRVLVNPLFGSWSHQIGYSKTMLISSTILLFGTLLYAQIQNIGQPEALIVAQTILGIGSGTLGVTRAFVADVTAKRNRTTYMALITAVQYGGFTVTPIIGSFFNYVFADKNYEFGIIRINMFTAPAYFMFCVVALVILSLLLFFQDRQRINTTKEAKKPSKKRAAVDEVANAKSMIGLTIFDCCILGCMLLNVSTKGSIAAFETLGIAIAQSHFDMLSSNAGAIVASCGFVGTIALLNMHILERRFSDVQIISGGMIVMCAGIYQLSFMHAGLHNPSWRYAISMFMIYSVGYPIGHTAVIGLFSKIVGRRPQGTLLGWFASAGSIARMIFPIMSGYLARQNPDLHYLFLLLTFVLIFSTLVIGYFRETLTLLSS